MANLKLKTLAALREFREGMDVTDYLKNELRQNWKALQQFMNDAGAFANDIEESTASLSGFQRDSVDITTVTITSTTFASVETIEFTNTKSRVRLTLRPRTDASSHIICNSAGLANVDMGIEVKMTEQASGTIFFRGKIRTQVNATNILQLCPIWFGEADLDPGTYTFELEALRFGASGTVSLVNYQFAVEEVV